MLYIAQLLVLGITYVGLGLGHIPGFRMNRPSLALIGSALLIALGVLDLHQAWLAIDPNTKWVCLSPLSLPPLVGEPGTTELYPSVEPLPTPAQFHPASVRL